MPLSERAKMVIQENDIILSTTDARRGAICLIDKRLDGFIALTGFAVIRKVQKIISRKYLFYALRFPSTLKQFEQRSSGGIYPMLIKNELTKVLIPFPPKNIQIQIAALMDRAYAIKKEKEAEAAQILDKAKQEVDDILLNT